MGIPHAARIRLANLPICRPILILSLAFKRWGPPKRHGLCGQSALCGVILILCPIVKRWGPPRWQWLCSQCAHLWATSHFVPHTMEVFPQISPACIRKQHRVCHGIQYFCSPVFMLWPCGCAVFYMRYFIILTRSKEVVFDLLLLTKLSLGPDSTFRSVRICCFKLVRA